MHRVAPARRNERKPAHSNEDPTRPKKKKKEATCTGTVPQLRLVAFLSPRKEGVSKEVVGLGQHLGVGEDLVRAVTQLCFSASRWQCDRKDCWQWGRERGGKADPTTGRVG